MRRFLSALLLLPILAFANLDDDPFLVGFWPLNGSLEVDSGDSPDFPFPAGASFAPDRFGVADHALQLDQSVVTVPLAINAGNSPGTLAFWTLIDPAGYVNAAEIFPVAAMGPFSLRLFGNELGVNASSSPTIATPRVTLFEGLSGIPPFPPARWVHFAIVYTNESTPGNLRLFMNGERVAETNVPGNTTYSSFSDLGVVVREQSYLFDTRATTSFDQPRYHGRALTDDEVGQLYATETSRSFVQSEAFLGVVIRFTAEKGKFYRVDAAPSLSGPWKVHFPVFEGTGAMISIGDDTDEDRQFYRAVETLVP